MENTKIEKLINKVKKRAVITVTNFDGTNHSLTYKEVRQIRRRINNLTPLDVAENVPPLMAISRAVTPSGVDWFVNLDL